jgi:hypothetical protein
MQKKSLLHLKQLPRRRREQAKAAAEHRVEMQSTSKIQNKCFMKS